MYHDKDYAGKVYLESQHVDTPLAWAVYVVAIAVFVGLVLLAVAV
jgi:hypothetical protein